MLAIGMIACAQTNNVVTKKLQLNSVPNGSAADKHLVIGSDKVVKQVTDNSVKTVNGITPINGNVTIESGSPSFLESDTSSTSLWNNGPNNIPENTAFGHFAIFRNESGTYNTALGYVSLYSNSTGSLNTAIGASALSNNRTGSSNTAKGFNSISAAGISILGNTAMGSYSLTSTRGDGNVAIGNLALTAHFYGDENTSVGNGSLDQLGNGSQNVAIGSIAGAVAGSGVMNSISDSSIFIGYNSKPKENGESNQIVIGTSASGNGSNTVTIGNSQISANYLFGTLNIGTVPIFENDAVAGQAGLPVNTVYKTPQGVLMIKL